MTKPIAFILNISYSIIGLLLGLISSPIRVKYNVKPFALILKVKSFWWVRGYMKNARAITSGNVILLGSQIEDKDLEHELVHVEQFQAQPLLFPILYYIELRRKGYRKNRYEEEAYQRAGNIYKGQ